MTAMVVPSPRCRGSLAFTESHDEYVSVGEVEVELSFDLTLEPHANTMRENLSSDSVLGLHLIVADGVLYGEDRNALE
jgi:hypothetical protein